VDYLGHVVNKQGVVVDPRKVEAIISWPSPHNVKALPRVLGLIGYYSALYSQLWVIAKPLSDLLKKNVSE